MGDIDYTNKDYEGFRTSMIEQLNVKLPEYTDNSSSDAGIVILELLAWSLDQISYYVDVLANEVFMSSAKERESVIEHTGKLGYVMLNSTPAKFYQVFEITPQGGDFIIPAGFRVKTRDSVSEESQYFELEEDLLIPAGMTGLEQTVSDVYDYKVSVAHGFTIEGDILGTSLEIPSQEFKLNNFPVIDSSIKVAINEGAGFVLWEKVDSFIDSEPESLHYMIITDDNDEFTIKLGNGNVGKIPTAYTNGISSTYRIGGGVIGNVGPNTIIELDESLSGIVNTFNPEVAYELGEEKESIESAKVNAKAHAQTLGRAVTLEDYENLAILDWDVRQTKSVWVESTRTVQLYMLPENAETYTTLELAEITEYYEEKKVLGSLFKINNPTFVTVDIVVAVKLLVAYVSQSATIEAEIESIITELSVIGVNGFGEPFVPSSFIAEIMSRVEGIQSIYFTTPNGDYEMLDSQIFREGTVTINIT